MPRGIKFRISAMCGFKWCGKNARQHIHIFNQSGRVSLGVWVHIYRAKGEKGEGGAADSRKHRVSSRVGISQSNKWILVKRSRISQLDPRTLSFEFWKTPSHLDPIKREKWEHPSMAQIGLKLELIYEKMRRGRCFHWQLTIHANLGAIHWHLPSIDLR